MVVSFFTQSPALRLHGCRNLCHTDGMKKLLLILTTALIFPSSAWTKNGNYMGLSWGEKCSAVADRFEGTGEGLIFKSNEKFRFRLWGYGQELR